MRERWLIMSAERAVLSGARSCRFPLIAREGRGVDAVGTNARPVLICAGLPAPKTVGVLAGTDERRRRKGHARPRCSGVCRQAQAKKFLSIADFHALYRQAAKNWSSASANFRSRTGSARCVANA